MTLKECYQILGLSQSASLEDVKHAYRQRAFELHPDLNPGLSDASQRFQKLNESYVILSKIIALKEARDKARKPDPRQNKSESAQQKTQTSTGAGAENQSGENSGPDANKNAQANQTNQGNQTGQSAQTGQAGPSQAEKPGQDAAGEARQAASETSADSGSSDATNASAGREQDQGQGKEKAGPGSGENLYAEQQEVLKDILNDAFARRVFEDIYSEIRKKAPPRTEKASQPGDAASGRVRPKAAPKPPAAPKGRNGSWWGQRKANLDFSKGFGGVLKDWLRSQIDEEQLFELPARRLIPGARIRLQIRHGFSDDVTTLDVTLPPDFRLDKPIRLKGMGKKLGRWQGDLYLRFSSKD